MILCETVQKILVPVNSTGKVLSSLNEESQTPYFGFPSSCIAWAKTPYPEGRISQALKRLMRVIALFCFFSYGCFV
jgi:hypothetical protein